jgi:tripartite-type tricarboxylate transporter receptor subunit TctC
LKDMSKLCVPLVALVAILAVAAPPARAQTQAWPQQPVRFIIPFGPGAGADIGARLIQDRLQARWGKPVVIENRPGGDSMDRDPGRARRQRRSHVPMGPER